MKKLPDGTELNTWDTVVSYIDPDTDAPVEGATQDNGLEVVQVYEAIDFGGLGL